MRLALPGQARERLQEVLKLQPGNLAAQITLGDVELQLENLDQAEEIYKRLAETLPDNKAVQERVAAMQALRGTGTAANPVQQAILTSERMKNEAKDQTAAAEQIVKYLEAQWKQIGPDPTLTIALARARMNFNQKDQALADVRTSLKANPDNKNLKQLEAALAAPDELSAKIAVIEMQRGSAAEFEIEWALYLAYDTHGKKAEADAAFAKAAALSPDEPRVLETQFVRALNAKDMATANQIADKAAKGNVDEVGGASFKARSLATEGRVNDAITVMREVVSRPAPSPESWRLLGRLQNLAGRSGDSVDSFRQALKLRPTDVQAINELVGTLAMTNRREEALAQARQSVRYAESDEAFFRLWMQLEGELGDRKMVVERRQRMRVAQPSDRENLVALARAMMDVGQLPEAREVIDTVGATAKDIDWVQVEAAWRWTSNDQTGAVMVFDEYLKSLEPQSAPAYLVFAQFLNERNDINGCIEVLTRARPLQDPKQMEVDRILSDVLFRAGRFAECVQGLEAILAANADDEGQNFRKRLAEVYVLLREWDKSEKALEGVTNRDNDVAVTLLSAEVAGGKGDAKGQRDTLDRAVVKFSGDARVFFKRGQLLMAQDPKSKDALADFSRALQLQPNLWQAYRLRAAIHANNNDIEGALADLRATIRLNPSDSRLVGGLIGDLIRMNRDQEAEVVGDEAMRGRPRDASLAYGIAETFFGAQRLAPARRFFKTAFDLDRQDAVAQRYLDALLVSENPSATEAERVLGLLGERVPKNAGFMMSAARVRMLQQKRQEAGQMAVAALRSVDPANFQAMMNWSVDMKDVLPDAGQRRTFYENAISQGVVPGATEWLAFFRARIDLDTESTREQGLRTLREILVSSKNAPLRAATYRTIGGQLYLISRYQESIDAMKPGLEEFPEDLELLNNTAFMLSKKLGKPADAMPFAERAAKLAPTSGEVLDTLGVTLLALNRPAEAEVQLRQAIAGASSAASQLTIAVHLVDALLTQNKTEEARQIMTAAQKLVDEVLKTEADPESVAELQKLRTKAGM
jgi:tetratricopeptide (TPR) repeat protein